MVSAVAGAPSSADAQVEAVEAALDAEDFTPLVRMVFDAVAASFSANITKRALLSRTPQTSAALEAVYEDEAAADGGTGRRASDRQKALRKEAAAPVIQALERIIETRSAELSQICRVNAEEIVASLQELEAVQRASQELRMRITSGDAALQDAGSQFLNGLEQLQELRRLQSSVAASCQAVGAAKLLLNLCTAAGRAISAGELHRGFRLLERAQTEFLAPPEEQHSQALGERQQAAAANRLDSGTRLHAFLSARVREMRAAIQQLAIKDFNEWLVSVREQAGPVGMLALRQAAWERQRRHSLTQARRRLVAELPSVVDANAAGATLARPLPLRSAGAASLDPTAHPAAASLLGGGGNVDPFADPLAAIDMTQLHRCLQMHVRLGKLADFQEYYQANRRTQLTNDLAAQGNFVAQHRGYLAQVVGFFVIDERVTRQAEELAGVEAGWDTAVAYLKLALETAFTTVTAAPTLLAIKDLVLLLCSALGQRGYHVAPLLDALTAARARSQALLVAEFGPQVQQAVAAGSGVPLTVASGADAAELGSVLGLPLDVGGRGEACAQPPFQAPFSAALPELLRLCRRHIEQSAAYAWGLASPAEVVSMVRQHRDALLLEAAVPALEQALAEHAKAGPVSRASVDGDGVSLDRALQHIADLCALSSSLLALDEHTVAAVRGEPRKVRQLRAPDGAAEGAAEGGERSGSLPVNSYATGLVARLQELRAKADRQLQAALDQQLRAVIGEAPPLDWLPEQPVSTASHHSQYVLDLTHYLQAIMGKLAQRLPRASYEETGRLLVAHLNAMLVEALLSEAVPGYNLYSLFRLNDDALALADFASRTDIPRMEEGLLELIQFCDLMVTGRLEDVLDADKRRRDYACVDLRRLPALLRKYREVGSTARKQPQSFLKKKTAEKVAKQLQQQLQAQAAVASPAK